MKLLKAFKRQMWYTPFFSVFFLFFTHHFPCWMSLVGFFICRLAVCFSMCGFAGFFLCYGTALVLLRVCSKGKCHLHNSMSMTGVTHISYFCKHYGFISFAFIRLCCACWPCPLDWAYLLHLQCNSHLHVVLHASLPSFQLWISNIQPLWTQVGFVLLPPSL